MMTPELSRRLAKVMNTNEFTPPEMTLVERQEFVRDAENCATFKDLPKKWQKKVLAAENEIQKHKNEDLEGKRNDQQQIGRKVRI